ncbi:vacuolar transporter chaperone [Physocladia obscura]|uniref:Vacuolar transporter chaperone complex subunit 4 n=1 Tax=Physocladia obscura TaxID=109957 RepID=A0AAD5T854_9FUNG|nr:vacuolar transporter chaperone [Physocladia obscura]
MRQTRRFYSLDYKELKTRISVEPYALPEHREFQRSLEDEKLKVEAFFSLKYAELVRRIEAMEKAVPSIEEALKPLVPHDDGHNSEYSFSENSEETSGQSEEGHAVAQKFRLSSLDQEIGRVSQEVKDLAYFSGLNFTAVKKILKKHDKNRSAYQLTSRYAAFLASKPFNESTYDTLIIRLSDLWDRVRYIHGLSSSMDKADGVDQQNIVRKTTKYWVHPDNIVDVKVLVLKHLPVLLFKKGVANDPALNSIYFDNDDLDLYTERMKREEGAQNLRFRWYGDRTKTDEVWVERKTHHEDWTSQKSIKERFPIKEKHMNDYLAGRYKIEEAVQELRAKGKKKEKDLLDMQRLGDEVQQMVLDKKLKPMIRTSYNRTAFQLPADARVRISLDTDLTLVREDEFSRNSGNWRRNDSGFPFKELPKDDLIYFPYAVLEIKLQTQSGQEAPQWAVDLANSHLVEEVPKFSKFHHAIANFHYKKVDKVPFWFYQMDRSIIKARPPRHLDPTRVDDVDSDDEDTSLQNSIPAAVVASNNRKNAPVKIDKFGKVYFSNERTFLRNTPKSRAISSNRRIGLSAHNLRHIGTTTFAFVPAKYIIQCPFFMGANKKKIQNCRQQSLLASQYLPKRLPDRRIESNLSQIIKTK